MKLDGPQAFFAQIDDEDETVALDGVEAAPARARIRVLALLIFAAFALLAGRAVQLALTGDGDRGGQHAIVSHATVRADIVDRNGALLATTVRAFALTATPRDVWDPPQTARALRRLFPDLDLVATERRLRDESRELVYLRRGLMPEEKQRVDALGLGGIGFEAEERRTYPNGTLAAHALGFTDVDLNALGGLELGLDQTIRQAGARGEPVRLSLDVRLQYALETELSRAARGAGAEGGAAILLDGRSGETLALASWPSFDPNEPGAASDNARRDRAGGDVHELGSTMKPFTIAMALNERRVAPTDRFDLMQPLVVDGAEIHDHEPVRGMSGLADILSYSSNIGAARLALRVGGERQRIYFERLGLLAPSTLELARRQAPLAPAPRSRRDVAGLGFGYGLAATPAALAGAYSVFANGGERVSPTLLLRAEGAEVSRSPVFTPETTQIVLRGLRQVVTRGTGRAADVPGLEIAGKTGTAEQLGAEGYDEGRNFSSFAGVFPARDPRYVIVLSLDRPHVAAGALATGGAVAAPAVGRIARRIAPILGLRITEPRSGEE
jgi:cell division protein FtsI (penicillin-binding protein 3)